MQWFLVRPVRKVLNIKVFIIVEIDCQNFIGTASNDWTGAGTPVGGRMAGIRGPGSRLPYSAGSRGNGFDFLMVSD